MRRAADFLGYLACWWAAILGAAHGAPWAGPATAVLYLGLHLGLLDRSAGARRRVALATLAGALVEQGNLLLGVTAYSGAPALAPAWMVALWAAFAATTGVSMAWLRGRPLLAAVLGAVSGPLTFLAGERLGALRVDHAWVLAVEWSAAMAVLARAPAITSPDAPRGGAAPG